MISYQESMWTRSDSFLGHTKISFCKYCSLSCYLWCVWHMTQLMHSNQHSKHQKKRKTQSARNSETSYPVDGRRFKGQNRDKSNWSEKRLKKKKREEVQIKKLIAAPCEAIQKLLLKNICHQKMYSYTYILLVIDH